MPFYEYLCKSCGHELEAMQKVTDSALRKCPSCGKAQLQRLMSAPVFRLKGGGWYETDFKGDKDNQRNLAERPEPEAVKEAKDTEAKSKDDKAKDAKDAKGGEPKAADSAPAKDPAAKDKPADKPAAAPKGRKKPLKAKRRR